MWHEPIVIVQTKCGDRSDRLLKEQLSEKEYAQIKGAMWPFRKALEELTDEEWELLQRLFAYSPNMKEAYILREELTQIFERHHTRTTAKLAIRAWCRRARQSQLSQFESFLGTIETWLEPITNYFLERLTSSFNEIMSPFFLILPTNGGNDSTLGGIFIFQAAKDTEVKGIDVMDILSKRPLVLQVLHEQKRLM